MGNQGSAEETIRTIKRKTRRKYSGEERKPLARLSQRLRLNLKGHWVRFSSSCANQPAGPRAHRRVELRFARKAVVKHTSAPAASPPNSAHRAKDSSIGPMASKKAPVMESYHQGNQAQSTFEGSR